MLRTLPPGTSPSPPLLLLLLSRFSCVGVCATPWTAAHQAPHPWDSPGKNTGVGCHFLLQCMKVKSESEVAQLCPTLSDPMDCSLPGFSVQNLCPLHRECEVLISEPRGKSHHLNFKMQEPHVAPGSCLGTCRLLNISSMAAGSVTQLRAGGFKPPRGLMTT